MSLVSLPGLGGMITQIAEQHRLPETAVEDALQEALLKGYERYRRSQTLDQQQFTEDYFENFAVDLDTEEEGFSILSTKVIVEQVEAPDHQISLQQVQEDYPEAQLG
ncbi:MAG: NusA N-terminal domain-containing protein, partial [Spirulinaceae cyanobacterium]